MKHNRMIIGSAAALGMLVLILDSKTALDGAREGIELCLRTVVPSLFPFFVLSILLNGTFTGRDLPLLRPLGRIFGVPAGGESILLSGFLGGYPVGAQSIDRACRTAALDKSQGQRMLAFCNNAGPAFIFGMAASLFPRSYMGWLLWGIQIVSAWAVSRFFPAEGCHSIQMGHGSETSFTEAVSTSLRIMAGVCAWVVLFRVLLTFLAWWIFWAFPVVVQVMLSGVLELSNGCVNLVRIENTGLRFILCSGMLSFGGLCVGMQTWSAAPGISKRFYFPGKLAQTAISVLIAGSIQCFFPVEYRLFSSGLLPVLTIIGLALLLLTRKKQKRSSIPAFLGV